jgi:Zinc finger, C3HC4 type (RING finger)
MQYLRSQPAAAAAAAAPEVDLCPVCMEVPGPKNVAVTACGHKFCMSCLLSSLKKKNTCPTCRAEIEPERECIEPLPVSVASELIRTEEQTIQLNRRLAVIHSFAGTNGRSAMILSLCREIAFATAHSIARWQTTSNKTYHKSWDEFDDSSDDEQSGSGSDSGSDN